MREIDVAGCSLDVFSMFHERWAIAAAGTPGAYQALTISWGSLGVLWGRNVVTVYVSPARKTFEAMDQNEYFTVSFFPEQCRDALAYMGSHSGRNGEKAPRAGLTPVSLGECVGFDEAELVFVCRKLYSDPFDGERAPQDIRDRLYAQIPAHHYFVGEIVRVLAK